MGAHLYAVQEISSAVRTMRLRRADMVSASCGYSISSVQTTHQLGGINLDDKYLLQYLFIYLIINILANKLAFFVWHGCGSVAAQFLANRATLKPLIFSPINKQRRGRHSFLLFKLLREQMMGSALLILENITQGKDTLGIQKKLLTCKHQFHQYISYYLCTVY